MLPFSTNVSVYSNREREKVQMQTDTEGLQSASPCYPKQEQRDAERMRKEQKINTMVHMQNLKVSTCILHVCGGDRMGAVFCFNLPYLCVCSVSAKAFLWMVFSGAGPKAKYG